ncbi:ABC transporter substrate-binding protein [Brevibacterium album]|uniref:ABC transporter substrate-binding protein n=1 Tax=Brevibacterium album TaxID=417948 RepID=UPI0003F93943|nr:ABC transporter substrate-binding protein [Brevibacterium album]
MHKKIWALAAAPLLLAACGGPAAEQAESGGAEGDATALTVALPTTSCLVSFENYVAESEGFFADEGVDIAIEAVNGSAGVLQAIAAGQADFGGPGATPVLAALERGEDVKYFLNSSPGGSFWLVTPSDSGIGSAAELEGKRIGVATADGNEVGFVDAIMSNDGVEADGYEKITVGEGGTAVAAFERGEIDAYAASADGYATIEHAGIPLEDITTDSVDYMFGNGYAAPAALIEEQREALVGFGRAWHRASQLGAEDPQKVIEICADYQPQEVEDEEYALSILELLAESRQPVSPDDEFGHMHPEHWEAILADAVEAGTVTDDSLSLEGAYTNDLVAELNE